MAIFNIAMFGLGWLELGKKFAATTLIATFYYPFILNRLSALAGNFVFTKDPMLCAIFAGVMIGFSLGIVIRSGAPTGGMDIPPLVLQKRLKIPVSVSMYAFDVAILLSQLLFRDREKILYGIIMVMIYTVILDKMLMMGKKQVQAKIISEKYEAINLAVQQQLDRGDDPVQGRGRSSEKAVHGCCYRCFRTGAPEIEPDRHGYRSGSIHGGPSGRRSPWAGLYGDETSSGSRRFKKLTASRDRH